MELLEATCVHRQGLAYTVGLHPADKTSGKVNSPGAQA